jgi:enoyl-CoA hydratase/carnithine racemase
MTAELAVEVRDHVAWVTVDRPAVRNALSAQLCRDLAATFDRLGADRGVRAIVLRGAGERVFVSGADINEFREALASPDAALAYDSNAELLQSAIRRAPQPVIAMIQGYAVGSGCIVAVACDFRIAAKAAKFGIPVAKFGFICPAPDALRLAALIGPARAKWLLMSAQLVDAERAFAFGLVDEVVENERLLEATSAFAATLAANAPLTLRATKELIEAHTGADADVYQAAAWYREIFASRDFQEGLDAFFAKRKPDFEGR